VSKFIFITGGVVSSLGKGLTSASVGMLLENRGLKIVTQKFDPDINVDPGTMSPYQHGEVYVLDDGSETDLDLGHYERFTNAKLTRACSVTTGQIYNEVITKERRGDYLGNTVQVIPHITDEIKNRIRKLATPDIDVIISEIGGTIGDIEGLPFIEAIRQFALEVGKKNVVFIHLTLVPTIRATGEVKTKPTQHSVGKLREIGIQPDILVCRMEEPMTDEARKKISLFCNVESDSVIDEIDAKTSIYEIPQMLLDRKIDDLILDHFSIEAPKANLDDWNPIVNVIANPDKEVTIALVGKYVELYDSYKSVYEAISHAGIANRCKVNVKRISSSTLEKEPVEEVLAGIAGLVVPGGFGERGIEGKITATRYARENRIPFLGLCLGLQVATIEFARNVCGMKEAHSTEFDPDTKEPIISLMDSQGEIVNKGGTMRLGTYPCALTKGSRAREIYGSDEIQERHRHRYEFNNAYRKQFEEKGVVFGGLSPDGKLVEIIELGGHPWFCATQFHPEFKSKPTKPHPLFRDFVRAVLENK